MGVVNISLKAEEYLRAEAGHRNHRSPQAKETLKTVLDDILFGESK